MENADLEVPCETEFPQSSTAIDHTLPEQRQQGWQLVKKYSLGSGRKRSHKKRKYEADKRKKVVEDDILGVSEGEEVDSFDAPLIPGEQRDVIKNISDVNPLRNAGDNELPSTSTDIRTGPVVVMQDGRPVIKSRLTFN